MTERYVAAVSGGIDSVVMLHFILHDAKSRLSPDQVIVAHVDHGIRAESVNDKELVQTLAKTYGCQFESVTLELGSETSEDEAREERHKWLRGIKEKYQARAVLTAHHEDDVLETIVINLIRGTGWRGLCSLRETAEYMRPLLTWGKTQIINYAIENSLTWHDDATNDDIRYLRNQIRHGILAAISHADRRKLLEIYHMQCRIRGGIEEELRQFESVGNDRYFLSMIDRSSARELLRLVVGPLEIRRLDELWMFAKTARAGGLWPLDAARIVVAESDRLVVTARPD